MDALQRGHRAAGWRPAGQLPEYFDDRQNRTAHRSRRLEARRAAALRTTRAAPLPNGNILVFDNGPHRLDESFPFSRVIEVNPATDQIVWTYQEPFPYNFYSPRISNAERLPNGNTLINEGVFGRFFEVTPDGEVVWE